MVIGDIAMRFRSVTSFRVYGLKRSGIPQVDVRAETRP